MPGPPEFAFASLEIESFRGIEELTVPLPASGPLVIVGANNAGKSTILDALALAMDGPSAHNWAPERDDYFCSQGKRAESFVIRLRFAAQDEHLLPAVRPAAGAPQPVHGALVVGRTEKGGRFTHNSMLMKADGKALSVLVNLKMPATAKEAWAGHSFSPSVRNGKWYDIAEYRPEVWLLRPSNLHPSLFQWKTGPLQRLSKLLAVRFLEQKWTFDHAGRSHDMPDTLQRAHAFFSAAIASFPFWRDDLRPRLENTLSQYVGRQAGMQLHPDISTLEEWLASQLLLGFAADAGGYVTPLERMGSGWQTLVRIACLEVLSQFEEVTREKIVLLFEEPETYLHPHLSRRLRAVLERLASLGWLVIVTTHSPDMISFNSTQTIARVVRERDKVSIRSLDVATVDGAAKFQERLNERGGHEMFFAQRVVLCEGQNDHYALRSYLGDRAEIDMDGMSISVIRAGDVGQLPAFAKMAGSLGIPWCAVSDEDLEAGGSVKPKTAEARAKLAALAGPRDVQFSWPKDLESCLGKAQGKADPEWQRDNVEILDNSQLSARCPGYVDVAEKVRAWVVAPP